MTILAAMNAAQKLEFQSAVDAAGGDPTARKSVDNVRGKNLFSRRNAGNMRGVFVDTNGVAYANRELSETHRIQVAPGDVISITQPGGPGGSFTNRRKYYDAAGNLVVAEPSGGPATFTIPSDLGPTGLPIVEFSTSVLRQYWRYLVVEKGVASQVYSPDLARAWEEVAPNPFQPEFLRQTLSRMMMLAIGETTQVIWNVAGDSYTQESDRLTSPLMKLAALDPRIGDAGGGWCGFGWQGGNTGPYTLANQPVRLNGNARPDTYPTTIIGSPTATYFTAPTPDLAVVDMAPGDILYQGFPALPIHNGCDLFFIGNAAGVIRVSWGTYNTGAVNDPASYTFGATTNYNTQNTVGNTQTVDIKANMPSGQGMLRVECVAAARVSGVNLKSAARGLRINKLSATGSSISQWAGVATATGYLTAQAALNPTGWFFMDGPNSQAAGLTAAQWVGNSGLTAVVNRMRSAVPGVDVFVATPFDNARTTNPIGMPAYAAAARSLSWTMGFAYLDLQPIFNANGNPAEINNSSTIPLIAFDDLHPSALGARLQAYHIGKVMGVVK